MRRRSRNGTAAALAGATLLVTTAVAHATCPAVPKGYDSFGRKEFFRTTDPTHRMQDDGLYLLSGAQPGIWPTHETFTSASVCAQFELPKLPVVNGVGLVFWRTDDKNFSAVVVFSDGAVALEHVVNGAYTAVASTVSPDIAQPTPNPNSAYDSNTLEAIVTGNRADIILNDLRLTTYEATPPSAPWTAGLFGYSQSTPFDARFYSAQVIKLH